MERPNGRGGRRDLGWAPVSLSFSSSSSLLSLSSSSSFSPSPPSSYPLTLAPPTPCVLSISMRIDISTFRHTDRTCFTKKRTPSSGSAETTPPTARERSRSISRPSTPLESLRPADKATQISCRRLPGKQYKFFAVIVTRGRGIARSKTPRLPGKKARKNFGVVAADGWYRTGSV